MAEAIALIIAGSGEVSPDEVEDLLNDAYPDEEYEEVGLIVPVDKDLFTPAVKSVVKWYDADKDVYPIQTKGASLGGRAASALGAESPQQVARFTDILTRDEFTEEDWDEVHLLLAMPEDEDDPDYEFYAEVADKALQAGFVVRNLCAALDDVTVIDPEDASGEAEPDPEPEEPPRTRRRRGKAAEGLTEDHAGAQKARTAAQEDAAAEEEPAPKRTRRAKKAETVEEVQEAVADPEPKGEVLEDRVRGLELQVAGLSETLAAIANALTTLGDRLVEARAGAAAEVLESAAAPAEDEDKPKRGRGRPRTDFDVRQVLNEETDEWEPRPKGRLRKGTQWRTIHAETDEVLDEGTA